MDDLSLSNALLDGVIRHSGVHDSSYEDDNSRGGSPDVGTPSSFPALIYTDPHKALDQRILFKPPTKPSNKKGEVPSSEKRRRHSEITPRPSFTDILRPDDIKESTQPKSRRFSAAVFPGSSSNEHNGHKRSWDIGQLFSKRKKQPKKGGTLTRSLSWDAIHRLHRLQEEDEEKEAPPQTFVYQPQKRTRTKLNRRYSPKDGSQELTSSSTSNETHPREESEKEEEEDETIDTIITLESQVPLVPSHDDEMSPNVYEVPRPTPVKPPRTKNVVLTPIEPVSPPIIKPRTKKPKVKRESFTIQDIVAPASAAATLSSQETPLTKPEDIGLLKIKVLAVRLPQAPVKDRSKESSYDTDDEEEAPLGPTTKVTPTDGLFCVLSINGKQSQYESSLQPLNTIKQASVWDQDDDDSGAVFYTTQSQQVFVRSYKLPLADVDKIDNKGDKSLASRAKADCVGVGILPISSLTPLLVKGDRGSVEDWTKVESEGIDVTVPLEPHGSVLLKASYTCLQPQASVCSTGTVIVTGLYGIDCFREGEACWTCCTIDIDTENCGTTSSKLGLEDCLNDGWKSEYIEFDAHKNMSCRIQLWGFTSQESEYWFGEVYIPLALVLPYSQQLVHQDTKDGPLGLLDSFERDITMPVEPKGHISVQFSMSPLLEENNINHTLKVLEESGLFKPEALAQIKSEVERDEGSPKITTIPEDDTLVSGAYDHLSPTPPPSSSLTALNTLTRRLSKNKMTLRLLGNMQLEVPKSYDERKHKLNTDIDPYRELEIVKVELKDTKAKLASSEFYREKAELKIKALEEEIWKLKKKQKSTKKKK